MKQYLDLLRDVRENGVRKPTRAKLKSTGEHIDALSVFGRQVRYNLADGFPLVTTKRVNFDHIVHELLWFLSGDTNIKYLEENGVRIWSDWADENGDLGPVYGAAWRAWNTGEKLFDFPITIDQIGNVIAGIKAAIDDPTASVGRRLIVSAWNVADLPKMALAPCHYTVEFNVTNGNLSCKFNMRSCDLFLGAPYNIASYALLTHLIAHVTGLEVGELIHSIGDAHIYTNHLDQVDEQLSRKPTPLPVLWIGSEFDDIDDVTFDDIDLFGYAPHPALRGEVAV